MPNCAKLYFIAAMTARKGQPIARWMAQAGMPEAEIVNARWLARRFMIEAEEEAKRARAERRRKSREVDRKARM